MTGRRLHPDHDPNDPGEAMAHRAMEAIKRAFIAEFALDKQTPNVTVVVTTPPDGHVGIATTEPTAELTLMALQVGWGAVHRAERLGL